MDKTTTIQPDKQITSKVWSELHTRLYEFILSRVHNADDADDILQDVFLKIHENLSSIRDEDRITSWIFQVTRNAIINHYRDLKKQRISFTTDTDVLEDPDPHANNIDISGWLRPFMARLPEKYQQALLLTELGDMSQVELAKQLGISISAAKMRVHRGRLQLKHMLLDCCHFQFDRRGGVTEYHQKNRGDCECTADLK